MIRFGALLGDFAAFCAGSDSVELAVEATLDGSVFKTILGLVDRFGVVGDCPSTLVSEEGLFVITIRFFFGDFDIPASGVGGGGGGLGTSPCCTRALCLLEIGCGSALLRFDLLLLADVGVEGGEFTGGGGGEVSLGLRLPLLIGGVIGGGGGGGGGTALLDFLLPFVGLVGDLLDRCDLSFLDGAGSGIFRQSSLCICSLNACLRISSSSGLSKIIIGAFAFFPGKERTLFVTRGGLKVGRAMATVMLLLFCFSLVSLLLLIAAPFFFFFLPLLAFGLLV